MDLKPILKKCGTGVRAILTFLFAFLVFGVMLWAYIKGFTIATSPFNIISLGFYGVLLSLHVLVQSFFAFVEHRRMRRREQVCSYTKTIGFTISAYQEDPNYLMECLKSVRGLEYPIDKLRIIMVVDGNSEDDRYMMEMFREVFADRDPGCCVWQNNYHSWDPRAQETNAAQDNGGMVFEDPQRSEVEELIRTKSCVCIMQKWGGKREVMYTAFKALGSSVDYIQVSDIRKNHFLAEFNCNLHQTHCNQLIRSKSLPKNNYRRVETRLEQNSAERTRLPMIMIKYP